MSLLNTLTPKGMSPKTVIQKVAIQKFVTEKTLTFEQVEPIWSSKLWPGRQTPITPFNQIPYLGGHDVEIAPERVTFLGVYLGTQLVAVASGYKTASSDYRVRGLFVYPESRRQGHGRRLLRALEIQARHEGCAFLWSAPRKPALALYLKEGFRQTSPWLDDGFEFGPNCFVQKSLS